MKFNEIAKNARIERRLSLRQFCINAALDPSNWSKVERGINPPPKDAEVLEEIAEHLGLFGDDRQMFQDAASVARAELPNDIANDAALIEKLPAFFRAMRGAEPDKQMLLRMVSDIQELHRSDTHTK